MLKVLTLLTLLTWLTWVSSVSHISYISSLGIHKSPMTLLWDHRAQHLIIYKIDLVLLLLLLIFCNTLLLYSLVFLRTITAPGIPVRRNTGITRSWPLFRNIQFYRFVCANVLSRFISLRSRDIIVYFFLLLLTLIVLLVDPQSLLSYNCKTCRLFFLRDFIFDEIL